jgi:hypothetical protein
MISIRIAQHARASSKLFGWSVAFVLALATLTGCGGTSEASATSPSTAATSSAPPQSKIQQASQSCHLDGSAYAALGDGGYTITLKGQPDAGTTGLPIKDIACVLRAVSVPDSVVSQMDSTRALDGMQKATWDKISASWTYHPTNGLKVILTESK